MNDEVGFADWYHRAGTALGFDMPRIAHYHCGPYQLAILLQDPGGPLAGSGAEKSGEIGVRNQDPTARFLRQSLSIPESTVVLLNALPGYGLKDTKFERERGAALNTEAIRRAGVRAVLVCGAKAQRVADLIDFGDAKRVDTHHPSVRGHSRHPDGYVAGKGAWQMALIEASKK